MASLRIYLIGAGVIARTHAAAIAKLPQPESVALFVADPNPAALAEFARQYPQARTFDDATTMLAEPAQAGDIAVVATPPFLHLEPALMALNSGRHVLCEKPLAVTRQQAEEMLNVARRNDRLLGCCSTRYLGLPTTEEVKRLVGSGTLGRLYHTTFIFRRQRSRAGVEYQPSSGWFLERTRSGGGILIDWGPYIFTTLNDVLKPRRVEVLSAWMANPATALDLAPGAIFDVEMHGGGSLRYHLPDGNALHVAFDLASCTHGEALDIAEIDGLEGAVRWDWRMNDHRGNVTFGHDDTGKIKTDTTTYTNDDPVDVMDKPLVYFYRRTQGQPSLAVVNEQAVFNFSCIEAMYQCAATGQPQSVTLD